MQSDCALSSLPKINRYFLPTSEVLSLEAAIDGHGVALVNLGTVARDVATGRLVQPFDITIHMDFGFFVVCPGQTADLPKNAAFREWLLAESADDQDTAS